MLLTLIKTRETRYGVHAVLTETNHIFGDKHLADVYIPIEEVPLDLIYRVSVPKSGIWLQGKRAQWLWPNRIKRKEVKPTSKSSNLPAKKSVSK
ncbi:MAG: hypothetical protein IJ882_05430 [Paludibacteraceae bacterium]|nr:hypothetical protein [Paludibacteraceae bacterium]